VRDTPRTDCPLELPTDPTSLKDKVLKWNEHKQPLNDLQMGFLNVVKSMTNSDVDLSTLKTERDGALFVMKNLQTYFDGQINFPELRKL